MPIKTVVYVVIQKLSDLVKERSEIFENNEVQIVTEELGGMQSILNNAQHQEQSSKLLSESMVRFLFTLYSVEDAIESFVLTETRLKKLGFVKKHIFFMANEFKLFREVLDATDYYENVRRLKLEIKKLSNEIQRLKALQGSHVTRRRRQPWQESDAYYAQRSEDSIFKKDLQKLQNQIISDSKPLQIISVFGEIGIGKSAHVKTIYNAPEVKNKFACRALLVVDTNWSLRDLILSILQQMTSSEDHTHLKDEDLIGTLYGFLKGKIYLIVINDITSLDLLQMLKGALPDAYNGSRVVITTPDEEAASFADPPSRYHFKSVDMDDGLTIFIEKVWGVKGSPFSGENMEDLKRKIAKICGGDALRIALLAGWLSTREVIYEDWSSVSAQLDFATNSPSLHFLDFCYNDLPLYLKPCLLYLGLFQKEYEIPVRRLSRLWLAEGFLKSSEEGNIPEDTAEGYLEELAKRNMVEISKRTSDDRPKKCRMTGSLHDIFRPRAVKVGLFHLHQKSKENSDAARESNENSDAAREHRLRVSRVVECTSIKDYPISKASNQNLQSYISFNNRKKYIHADEVGTFLESIIGDRGFGLLKVLDLEGVDRPQLPENLGNLFHLRYLGLRYTFLKTLPSSLGALLHLETLDIKETQITTLPSSIWSMQHLRHLCLNGARQNIAVQLMIHKAPSQLQILSGLFIDEKIARTIDSALIKMTNLRKLDLTIESSSAITTNHSSSNKEVGLQIPSLSSLRSLRLRSKDHMGQPSELNIIKPFSRLENLSQLYLLGKLLKPLDWYQIPTGLKVLTLSVSRLDKDPMPTLSKLPSLIDLRLLAASYEGKGMCSPANGFPALQVLKLWKLKDLETLTVNEGAMQKLHTLEIRCCEKLKDLPETLLKRETFRKLILTNMPKTFEKEMVWRAKDHFDLEVDP